jgi:hypothetical protein
MFADIRAGRVVLHREWMIRAFVMHASVAELWIRLTRMSNTEAAAGWEHVIRPRETRS